MNDKRKQAALEQYHRMMEIEMSEKAVNSVFKLLKDITKIQKRYAKKMLKVIKSRDTFNSGKIKKMKPMKRRTRR